MKRKGSVTVSVVGTAGRSTEDLHRLSNASMDFMVDSIHKQIRKWGLKESEVTLVSGGSAWADHSAVKAFMDKEYGLKLFLPCPIEDGRFKKNPRSKSWRDDPASTLNDYHQRFKERTGIDVHQDFKDAKGKGADLIIPEDGSWGYMARNSKVAKSEYLIAFTFGKDYPASRGTMDTWKKCKGIKVHFSLVGVE